MSEIRLTTQCPHCATQYEIGADISPIDLAPTVRGKIQPVANIQVYKLTSDEIKEFIIQKARKYCPDVKVEVVPRYCEKKKRSKFEPHRSYASLRIAFSENVIEKKNDFGWYGKIGESDDNIRFIPSMFHNIIKMYQYNPNDVNAWLKSYKTLEELEDSLGITEAFINDLRMYVKPQRIKSTDKSNWIIFAAAAENVIRDILTDVETNAVDGRIEIRDIYPISKDNVEFLIYVHPSQMDYKENPHVRQILLGEEKPKK